MPPKQWFLVVIMNGRPAIMSILFDSKDEAMECYEKQDKDLCIRVCETIYG